MFFGLNDVAFLAAVSAPALDPDAAVYIAAVEAADTQALEPAVRAAINDFVVGCKADGIWAAIKASCILAGARTRAGALTPLVGPVPTEFGTAGGWNYNRATGLAANGTDNYLNSGRGNAADPQDNNHNAVWVTTAHDATVTGLGAYIGTSSTTVGHNGIGQGLTTFLRNRSSSTGTFSGAATGFLGHSRNTGAEFQWRTGGQTNTAAVSSAAPVADTIEIFRRGNGAYCNGRLAFYSIGESLDLALLDARVTALINAFDAAI
jgi:hypothetical protein